MATCLVGVEHADHCEVVFLVARKAYPAVDAHSFAAIVDETQPDGNADGLRQPIETRFPVPAFRPRAFRSNSEAKFVVRRKRRDQLVDHSRMLAPVDRHSPEPKK